ncbi:PAAR domain-containing protein [Pseudomonas sp. Irchel 3E13]|uniref:PAAR domain-containing protein n=1 Tax=Pseudomonas sp. Irchel 3E13 TaxID=2008975 RepID=UPI000BA49AD7|nr:PAAR domain-containing protein [Pseudomonas sp. Irchel 3E13]
MMLGYLIRMCDKTTCGGQVLTGDSEFIIEGLPSARQGDSVTCGVTGKTYQIHGGIPSFINEGVLVAGSLDSFSGCPCYAGLIPSDFGFSYESTNSVMAPRHNQPSTTASSSPANPAWGQQSFAQHQQAVIASAGANKSRSITSGKPLTPELIAVAGSQHDNGSGNKMIFIGQAVRELAQFKRFNPALTRTLVVFTPSYNEDMLIEARGSADVYGADIVEITTTQEFIDYLNHGKERRQSPIEQLSIFSHGVPQQIAFGYQLPGHFQMSLDVLDYHNISPEAFSETARLDSYACRTGMGNLSDYPIEDGVQLFPQTNESLAQLLANHLRIKVGAFIRRSDYKNTWGSFNERRMGNVCDVTHNVVPHQEWCGSWELLKDERKLKDEDFDFTYQARGALNPVISGDTPFGAPDGYFEFLPK